MYPFLLPTRISSILDPPSLGSEEDALYTYWLGIKRDDDADDDDPTPPHPTPPEFANVIFRHWSISVFWVNTIL